MHSLRFTTFLSVITLLLLACGSDTNSSGSQNTTINSTNKDINISINSPLHIESLGIANTIHANIDLGSTGKNVYVLLSNYASSAGSIQITSNHKINTRLDKKYIPDIDSQKYFRIHAPKEVELFRKNIKQYLENNDTTVVQYKSLGAIVNKKDVAGDVKRFYLNEDTLTYTDATARKVVSDVTTNMGTKTLSVWVSDDSFDECRKEKCVTQAMVDALADTFLQVGKDNDIYDWVTNVYGEEWGNHSEPDLITASDEITILLTDIPNPPNNTYNTINGGVLGYFYSKDNIKKSQLSGSNERIMFYIDSVLFANGEGAWGIDDYWPKEMVSTLAHEFQHMIHFYQKTVLLTNIPTDTWINEMLSETTEDLVATKIKHTGSRGVDPLVGSAGNPNNTKGRYPRFNANNTISLTTWQNDIDNYSNVNAFGAYLIRNYGGAKVLHDILYDTQLNEQAVVNAVNKAPNGAGKTFNDLLKEWGIAVLLSDDENLDNSLPTYNTGDFTLDTYKNSTYELGSVNFFNYSPAPKISNAIGTVAKQGNYYYKVGTNVTGDISIDLRLNGQTEATLITKESK